MSCARARLIAIVGAGMVAAGCTQAAPSTTTTEVSLPGVTSSSVVVDGGDVGVGDGGGVGVVFVGVGEDVGGLVDGAEPGTVFVLGAGVHRLVSVVPKDGMSFVGEPGAVLSGAVVLEGFVFDGGVWRLGGVERRGGEHGVCVDGYEGCRFGQDVFMDDVMLWQVTSVGELGPGRWMWDGDVVVVADDPSGRRVELSVVERAFMSAADGVTIRDVVVEKYATPAQSGAIQAQLPGDGPRGWGWVIEGVEVRWNHGAGIRTGDGTVVRGVFAHHNGQLGVSVSGGRDVVVEDSVISGNNVAGFLWGWEAGGLKATRTVGLVVRGVVAEDNAGPGLWTDIDARDTVYEGNTVRGNAGPGIFHEISYAAVIRDNVVEGNGFGHARWLWGSGILVAVSSGVEVVGNTVRGNHNAITLIQQRRGHGDDGRRRILADVWVHGNEIWLDEGGYVGFGEATGDESAFLTANVRFEGNTYVGAAGPVFAWRNRFVDRDEWMRFGHDRDGTWR